MSAIKRINVGLKPVGELLYRFHGKVRSIEGVFDGGALLTYRGEMPSIESFFVMPGCCVSFMARGLIKLGAEPVFAITADATGENLGPGVVQDLHELAGCAHGERRDLLENHGLFGPSHDQRIFAKLESIQEDLERMQRVQAQRATIRSV